MPPTGHALLSASSAHRWLECTAAPLYEQMFPGGTSVYAEEGSLAHEFCELAGRAVFKGLSAVESNAKLDKLRDSKLYDPEMERTANQYVEYLRYKAAGFSSFPYLDFEVRVDLTDFVPDGFGTCDCIMIGGDTLHITDYKHGQGVQVSAVENPQMRLYALGALKKYRPIFGDQIKKISMGIFQPRITLEPSEDELTVDELINWGENVVKPAATKAYTGQGEYKPGDHCRFCRGKAQCRARMDAASAIHDFAGVVAIPHKEDTITQPEVRSKMGLPPYISMEEVAWALEIGKDVEKWYADLKEYAKQAMLNGEHVPGYKVVAGKSDRAWANPDAIPGILLGIGYREDEIYKPREMLTLTGIEKMLGKKKFTELLGDQVVKPIGKPALALESDKRPAYSPAAKDFEGIKAD